VGKKVLAAKADLAQPKALAPEVVVAAVSLAVAVGLREKMSRVALTQAAVEEAPLMPTQVELKVSSIIRASRLALA
jgi:hypothetical protein